MAIKKAAKSKNRDSDIALKERRDQKSMAPMLSEDASIDKIPLQKGETSAVSPLVADLLRADSRFKSLPKALTAIGNSLHWKSTCFGKKLGNSLAEKKIFQMWGIAFHIRSPDYLS